MIQIFDKGIGLSGYLRLQTAERARGRPTGQQAKLRLTRTGALTDMKGKTRDDVFRKPLIQRKGMALQGQRVEKGAQVIGGRGRPEKNGTVKTVRGSCHRITR